MSLDVTKVVSDTVGEIVGKLDGLITSGEERGKLRYQLAELESKTVSELARLRVEVMRAQADVIKTEATGEEPVQRKWRPWVMLTFAAVIVYSIVFRDLLMWGFLAAGADVPQLPKVGDDVPEGLWILLQIGIGGYIGGRSAEKIAKAVNWSSAKEYAAGMFDKRHKR